MVAINDIIPTFERLQSRVTSFVRENPILVGAGTSLAGAGSLVGLAVAVRKRRKKKKSTTTKRKRKKTTRKRKTTKRRTKRTKRMRKTPRTAGKGKDRSTRRIRHTKKGQPYVILKSGKARFIKKSSARRSRKLKGGRY